MATPKKNIVIEPDLMKFIDKMGTFYENLGISRIGGRMVGLMLVADKPLSPEDISGILGVSRSSISNNIKILIVYGFLDQVTIAGDRKEYFAFSKNAWEHSLKTRIGSYQPLSEIISEGILALKKGKKPVNILESFIDFIEVEKKYAEETLKAWKTRKK